MANPMRTTIHWARTPLTYSSGTTPGEQEITASTTAPTLDSHGFTLAGQSGGGQQYAPAKFMDLVVELINDGASPDDIQENFSLWWYFPDAGSTNKWRESAPFVASGVNKRGAVGADAALDPAGNVYKIDVPQGATRAFIHVPSLTTNIAFRVLAYPDN